MAGLARLLEAAKLCACASRFLFCGMAVKSAILDCEEAELILPALQCGREMVFAEYGRDGILQETAFMSMVRTREGKLGIFSARNADNSSTLGPIQARSIICGIGSRHRTRNNICSPRSASGISAASVAPAIGRLTDA